MVDSEPAADVLRAHPRVARITFGNGANAFRTSMDLPIAQAASRDAVPLGSERRLMLAYQGSKQS